MSDELAQGQIVGGRFRLAEPIGRGGFGVVWRGEDQLHGGAVAIKFLHARHRSLAWVLKRFVREAEVLARLDHPNLARCLAFSGEGEHVFLALEFIEGYSLEEELLERAAGRRYFTADELEDVTRQVAAALEHAHAQGVIHRDLKPANVMLLGEGRRPSVKVLDFGVAKILEDDKTNATTRGRVLGSLYYLAPEQIAGSGVDARTDVFSLATLVFEMATLRRGWMRNAAGLPAFVDELGPEERRRHNAMLDVMRRIRSGPRPRPSELVEGVSPGLDRALARAWAPVAAERPATALEFVDEVVAGLRGFGAESTSTADLEPPAPDPTSAGWTAVVPRDLEGGTEVRAGGTPTPAVVVEEVARSVEDPARSRRSAELAAPPAGLPRPVLVVAGAVALLAIVAIGLLSVRMIDRRRETPAHVVLVSAPSATAGPPDAGAPAVAVEAPPTPPPARPVPPQARPQPPEEPAEVRPRRRPVAPALAAKPPPPPPPKVEAPAEPPAEDVRIRRLRERLARSRPGEVFALVDEVVDLSRRIAPADVHDVVRLCVTKAATAGGEKQVARRLGACLDEFGQALR